MSILGYSAAYFLPEHWAHTPLYGEKIIPLIDYMLSTDYTGADKLASAYYDIQNKYKNTNDLPLEKINELIDESGFSYVRNLLGEDEDNVRLLLLTLCLIQSLKGSGKGIEVILNLLRREENAMVYGVVGDPEISSSKEVSEITVTDYVQYSGFTTDSDAFELTFQIRTPSILLTEQCIASCSNYKFALSVNSNAKLQLSLGTGTIRGWDILNKEELPYSCNPSSTYYIKLSYTGYEYELKVSRDGNKYINVYNKTSITPIEAHKDIIYIGVNNSTGTVKDPFNGFISLAPFSVNVENVKVIEWHETNPVGTENTFKVKADLDIDLVSSDFFGKFSDFVKKYVYPTLEAFEAKMKMDSNLAFIPYARSKINYVALGDLLEYKPFKTVNETAPTESVTEPHVPYEVVKENAETESVSSPHIPFKTF